MTDLVSPPHLEAPTVAVRESYLSGERDDMLHRGSDIGWLDAAADDFDGYVAARVGVTERHGVPSEIFWFVSGAEYIGSLVLRLRLTDDEGGGHIGYHVVHPWQRRGHATRMLAQGVQKAAERGISDVLLTVAPANVASRRVIERTGGVLESERLNHEGELRYWISASSSLP